MNVAEVMAQPGMKERYLQWLHSGETEFFLALAKEGLTIPVQAVNQVDPYRGLYLSGITVGETQFLQRLQTLDQRGTGQMQLPLAETYGAEKILDQWGQKKAEKKENQ